MEGNISNSKRRRYQSNKSMKHLLERQRRARINYSLSELKNLVLSAIHRGNPHADLNGCEKMEKAEILELTVNYIKAIKTHSHLGEWKVDAASQSKRECCHPNCSCAPPTTKNASNAEIFYRESSYTNYIGNYPYTHAQSSYHGSKPPCSCFRGAHIELITPPVSPSSACVVTQRGAHTPPEPLRKMTCPQTTVTKVWRPW